MEEKLYTLETYNYSLPKELIAQYPCDKRDESKLLCFNKVKKEISHHVFRELPDFLSENDVLVLNNTKVIRARFYAENEEGKTLEILLINSVSPDNLTWKIFSKPMKYLKNCKSINLKAGSSLVQIQVIDSETIKFKSHDDLKIILDEIGQMPLPPYIKRDSESAEQLKCKDEDRYQTVFAKELGAVAAPTASLHFTGEVLEKIKNKGVEILYITLHVGPGTFLPIRTDDVREHKLIPENYFLESEVWEKITQAKKDKKRIIACGTTVVRTLEYVSRIKKLSGLNSLYIDPDFKYEIVDAMITNFHLPKTSLLVLVSAFIGWENLKSIYEKAIDEKYRFFSYGDAMFLG